MKRNFKHHIDRIFSSGVGRQLMLFVFIFLASWLLLVLLYSWLISNLGFERSIPRALADILTPAHFSNIAYGNEHTTAMAMLLAALAGMVGGVVFQGLLIATITNMIRSRSIKVKSGDVSYHFDHHVLMLGFAEAVAPIIEDMKSDNIVIAVEDGVDDVRELLQIRLSEQVFKRTTVLHADMISNADLERLHVGKASAIFIVGNRQQKDHDIRNVESYKCCMELLGDTSTTPCYVMIDDPAFFTLIQNYGLKQEKNFHPFNYCEAWARELLVDGDNRYSKLDWRSEEDNLHKHPEKYVHMVILGMSQMGEALANEMAFIAHYPNYVLRGVRTKVTCVDPDCRRWMEDYVGRHHTLFQYCHYTFRRLDMTGEQERFVNTVEEEKDFVDLEFEFVQSEIPAPMLQDELEAQAVDPKQLLTLAVCFDDDSRNTIIAHTLPEIVYSQQIPVWLYRRTVAASIMEQPKFSKIQLFGSSHINVVSDSQEVAWAKEINQYYMKQWGSDQQKCQNTEQNWNASSLPERWSSIYNASHLPAKLRSAGVRWDPQSETPIANWSQVDEATKWVLSDVEHNRWIAEKLMIGYRSPSQEELATMDRKTLKNNFIHPDICPYHQLTDQDRQKDRHLLESLVEVINQTKK